MRQTHLPYLFLVILCLIALVMGSVRYGIQVQKKSQVNEYMSQLRQSLSLSPTPITLPLKTLKIHAKDCPLTYLTILNEPGITDIICPTLDQPLGTDTADLVKSGYEMHEIGTVEAYIKPDPRERDLILNTLQVVETTL